MNRILPKNRIEIYDDGNKIYTLDAEAAETHIREILTNGIGTWNFILPSKKNGDFLYNDIAVHKNIKIYLDYDTIGTTLITKGKICKITDLCLPTGYVKVFEGKNQGEVLERRFKRFKEWQAIDASTIVTELANDLGLGTGQITADTTDVTLRVETESYFDVLKKLSDYWYDASNQIKKDFYVDVDNNLVWKTRPIRTAGVETLTVGHNINNYSVLKDVMNVKNRIYIYGMQNRKQPTDESWTESLTNWNVTLGSLELDGSTKKVGSYSIKCEGDATGHFYFYRNISALVIESGCYLILWALGTAASYTLKKVRLRAPDASNYFEATLTIGSGVTWELNRLSLGTGNEYDANFNPNGAWTKTGSPSWFNIQAIEYCVECGVGGKTLWVDGLLFYPLRFNATVENATSQTNYGVRELEYADDNITSDSDCTKRGQTLLYQLKDPVTRVDLEVNGNNNVKIGDRLVLSIPSANISSQNFDIVVVEHDFIEKGWTTKVHLVDSANTRQLPTVTPLEIIRKELRMQQEIARGIQIVK